ncbi:SusC/RagA family TonB-linked outer membrane protein [Flammeovirgaceae bacterium SG7u.111]|nr:SusC/RagA family TonB-linked outer membrane protein [Flammeovirgaceae bacterium SG7u.132]WPO33244.1 SusC/RagA family TonB-linked outer membrane protein [Flammeovirgaceae bacterium SG7u.111]
MKQLLLEEKKIKHLLLLLLFFWGVVGNAQAAPGNNELKEVKIQVRNYNGSVNLVFKEITKKTGFSFVYEDGISPLLSKNINIQRKGNLYDLLVEVAVQANLDFKAINKTIIVKGKSIQQKSPVQAIKVSGKVISEEDSEGLPGVNILIKGTTIGTISDIDGNYSLNVPNREAVLVFSSVGFIPQEVPVGSQTEVNINLAADVKALQEVVVTALGIEREQKSLGYAVGNVDGGDLTHVNQENVLNSLAGRVPGVVINSTGGSAGSSVSMIIRGATSLNSDNQPLYVIDGVPVNSSLNNTQEIGRRNVVDYGNAISDINPDDIENISVLKGPSAAALYGSRAGNGVVLITTKKGKKSNGLGVSVNSSTVFDRPYKFLDMHNTFATGERPYTPDSNPFSGPLEINEGSSAWVGPELDKGYSAVQWNSKLDENGDPIPYELTSHPDRYKDFVQTGITSTNNIAIANIDDQLSYRLSFTNMTNRGIIPNSDLFRNTLNINTKYQLTKKVFIGANVNIGRSNSNNRPAGNRGANPLQAMYDVAPHIDMKDLEQYWVPGQEGIQQRSQAIGDYNNPYFLAYEANNAFVRNRVFGNLNAQWDITNELSVRAKYSHDQFNEQRETKIAKSYTEDANGIYGLANLSRLERNTELLLSYNKKVGVFDVMASLGGNMMYQHGTNVTNQTQSRGLGLITPGLYNLSNIHPDALQSSSYWYEKAIYSVFGMASFGFKDMLYLDVAGRNDWSSTLPEENRSYFYPSVSMSALINEMVDLPSSFNLIKVRAGWAQVGNDTDPYKLDPVLSNVDAWGNVTRLAVPSSLLTPDLKPERATSTEVGIDLGFFQSRLRFEGTYYTLENENQILPIGIPIESGYSSKQINAGLLSSKGWELMLGVTPIQNSDLVWDLNFNLTQNRTKIEKLTEGIERYVLWTDAKGGAWTFEGETIGDIYDRELVTVEDPNSPYFGYPILDEDGGWNDINAEQTKNKIGNFNPDFILGMQTSVSYKSFTLTASFDWRNGGEFVSQTYRYGESDLHSQRFIDNTIKYDGDPADLPQYLKDNADQLIIDGINIVGGPTADLGGFEHTEGGITLNDGVFNPGVIEEFDDEGNFVGYKENLGGEGTKYIRFQDNYPWSFTKPALFDASFIKLREVSLSYSLPKAMLAKAKIQNATVSLFSRNIMIWTKAKVGIDPEMAFQPEAGTQGSGSTFKQGIERYNVTPWVMPVGAKLSLNF